LKRYRKRHKDAFISFLTLFLFCFGALWIDDLFAHERWILTPTQVLEWNTKPKPDTYTQFSLTNFSILGIAFLFTLGWVRLNFSGAREMLPDLQSRLASYSDYSSVVLRFCLAWALISSAFAVEPRFGNERFVSPTLFAPDLELLLLPANWYWLREVEIGLGLAFLFGIWVRLASVVLLVLLLLALYLFGLPMVAYLGGFIGVSIYLLLRGPATHYLRLPVPSFVNSWIERLAVVPLQRAQFLLRVFTGLNFLYLAIYFKVLQPNLALAVISLYDVPILSKAPEVFVLIMAVIETLVGVFLIIGALMRPVSIILLGAFFFFVFALSESMTAHILYYGIVVTFLFNSAGHWALPKPRDKCAHIVILGGGLAAINAAIKLEKLRGAYTNINVTLISRCSEFLFYPLLPEVIGGSVQPGNVVNPIRRILENTRVIRGEIKQIDSKQHRCSLSHQHSGKTELLEYDELIIAEELIPNFDSLPGLVEHGHKMESVGDALNLRQHITKQLVQAEQLPAGDERRKLLSFAIIGGNERGSALSVEIHQFLNANSSAYPDIDPEEINIILYDGELSNETSSVHQWQKQRIHQLLKLGIQIIPGPLPAAITAKALFSRDGKRIPCGTVVNARYRLADWHFIDLKSQGGRVYNAQLRLKGTANVWVASTSKNRNYKRTDTLAELEALGEMAAYNAWAHTQGYPTKQYKPPYSLVQTFHMGRYSLTTVFGIHLSGRSAWFLSRIRCMIFLPGLERNLRMIVDWFLDLVFRNDIAVLSAERKTRLNRAFYHLNDVIVREGEVGDCAFLIRSGQVVIQKNGCRIAKLGSGECFGEIALLTNGPRTATVVATTPVELTILRREQFLELTASFRPLRDALKRQIEVRVKQLQQATHQS
jgi:NADH dehydrogenase FAD-containing subunit/uncharacterized membrane protein YphA (DoxX/SURF4 family)